jgi:1-deoxy-D-xylulose-5-phosphate synthase
MDIGFLRMMPNMVLVAPANDVEMALSLEFALNVDKPVVIRYPKDSTPPDELVIPECNTPFELGKSVVVKQNANSSVAIVAYGTVLSEALLAANFLEQKGIAVDVINARFAAPVDEAIFALPAKNKGIITVEDHGLACGFGSAVLEQAALLKDRFARPIMILGAPREFIKHDSRKRQFMKVGINADEIAASVKQMYRSIKNGK